VLENFSPGELDRLVQLLKRFSLSLIRREDTGTGLCLWCAAYCQEHCPVGDIRGGCPYGEFRGAA